MFLNHAFAPKVAVNKNVARLDMPCRITIDNIRSLVMRHTKTDLKYVFHFPTKSMAVGDKELSHLQLAKKVFGLPESMVMDHKIIMGGMMLFTPAENDMLINMKIGGISPSDKVIDPLAALNYLIRLVCDKRSGLKIVPPINRISDEDVFSYYSMDMADIAE